MKKQDILTFWRNIEILDLPQFETESYLLKDKEILPWIEKKQKAKKNYKYRYTLIFGKIEKKYVVKHIKSLLADTDLNDWEEPVRGFTCLSALVLDQNGCPQIDSYFAASYTFGIAALEKDINLTSVSEALKQVQKDYPDRYNFKTVLVDEEEVLQGNMVSWETINKEIEYLKANNTWLNQEIRVYLLCEEVHLSKEPNTSFFNSFYVDDLNYLSSLKDEELSSTLKSYLQLKPCIEKRIDLIKNKEQLFDCIDPQQMTWGRWASNIEYGLYTAQLGAVNSIFSKLRKQEGIQGVNGPPGTGKTTLLKDVIAEVIVDRAKVISDLGCDNILEKKSTKIEREPGDDLHTYKLNHSLSEDFGIVVASNNNAAVENITKELPLRQSIDIDTFPDIDYFSDYSQRLIEKESWGIVAAALGNMKNRSAFKKAFWNSDEESDYLGFESLLYSIYKNEGVDKTAFYKDRFEKLNHTFKSLLEEFDTFKETASLYHKQLPLYVKNKEKEIQLKKEQEQINKQLKTLSIQKTELEEQQSTLKKDSDEIHRLLDIQSQRKPSFFFLHKLFATKTYKRWDSLIEDYLSKLKLIDKSLNDLKKSITDLQTDIEKYTNKRQNICKELSELDVFFNRYYRLQHCLNKEYEIDVKNLFNLDFYQKDIDKIHLLNPYHSAKVAKLRSNIFITALQLHENAILANAKQIRNNLNAYFEMLTGNVNVKEELVQNLWDTFFLCIPVVSTTLASASRLFPHHSKNQIGWLLIDEAGQATPQSVAGLIHRSKRCVIVGDPLQVEPVVTIPEKLVAKLRNDSNVDVTWSPCKVSVQQLADRISQYGTYMQVGNSDEKIWTGFPLRTHRRCDDPMFSIANQIAYSNQMVKAINSNSQESFIGASAWFDVKCVSAPYNKHVIPEEIKLLEDKINELQRSQYSGDIYIISPFKSIADGCDRAFKNQKNISCGTIHKFQGKEADIVFLVLGSNPASSGARNWASQKPNMLNVALTRAKKRFYVIGNKDLWGGCNYFNVMNRYLN